MTTVVDDEVSEVPPTAHPGRTARLRARLRFGRRRPSTTDLVVLGLLGVQLLYRAVISRPGYFWQDDYFLIAWAEANPLSLDYLALPASDHYQPLGLAALWVCQHLFPSSYGAAMLWTALLYVVAVWLLYRLLRSLFGWRTQFYLVLLLVSFGTFTLQTYLWYAASVWFAPLLATSFGSLLAIWRYVGAPSPRRLAVALVWIVLLSLSHTFGALTLVLALAMVALVPHVTTAAHGQGVRAILCHWRLWILALIPFLAVPVFYLSKDAPLVERVFSPPAIAEFVTNELVLGVLPGLVGGPWVFSEFLGPEWPIVTPYALVMAFQTALVALVVVPSVKRRTVWLWIVGFAIVILELVVVSVGRTYDGAVPVVMRYASPAIIPLSIAMAYSMAVPRSDPRGWRPRARPLTAWWRGRSQVGRVLMVGALAQVLVLSMAITTATPVWENPRNSIRAYVERGMSQRDLIPGGVQMIPQYVPNYVIGQWAALAPPSTQVVFGQVPGSPVWADFATDRLFGYTSNGDVVEQEVDGVRSRPGPNGKCGWAVVGATVVRLQKFTTYGSSTGDLGVLSAAPHPVRLELIAPGNRVVATTRVVVPEGLERVFFPMIGVGDRLRVIAEDGGSFCVTDLEMGERVHRSTTGSSVIDPPSARVFDYALPTTSGAIVVPPSR